MPAANGDYPSPASSRKGDDFEDLFGRLGLDVELGAREECARPGAVLMCRDGSKRYGGVDSSDLIVEKGDHGCGGVTEEAYLGRKSCRLRME